MTWPDREATCAMSFRLIGQMAISQTDIHTHRLISICVRYDCWLCLVGDDGNSWCSGTETRRCSYLGHHCSCHCWCYTAVSAHCLSLEGLSRCLSALPCYTSYVMQGQAKTKQVANVIWWRCIKFVGLCSLGFKLNPEIWPKSWPEQDFSWIWEIG